MPFTPVIELPCSIFEFPDALSCSSRSLHIPGSRLLMPLRAGPYIYCDFRRDSNASYLGIIQIAETQPNVE